MASHDPRVGDLTLVHLRQRIVDGIGSMFADGDIATIMSCQGPITAKLLRGVSTSVPGILVAYEGVGDVESNGSTLKIPAMVCVAVVTKAGKSNDDQCCAITTRIIRKATDNRWNTHENIAGVPVGMRAHNLYDGESGKIGGHIWAITWRQDLTIPLMSQEEYDDKQPLRLIFSTYTGETPSTPVMETASTFPADPEP